MVVLEEIGSDGRECPDVIGWKHGGACTLIECKTTRADFKRDFKKRFRQVYGATGMGAHRWYATPPGLLTLGDLPTRWGLIEVRATTVRTIREPTPFTSAERNMRGETACLISAVQRATAGWGRKVFGEINPVRGQLDPHPSMAKVLEGYRKEIRSLRGKLAREMAL